jgi:hypothetical protein
VGHHTVSGQTTPPSHALKAPKRTPLGRFSTDLSRDRGLTRQLPLQRAASGSAPGLVGLGSESALV